MSKMVTWISPHYKESAVAHETDGLFYGEDVVRYMKFNSPLSIKFCLADALRYQQGKHHIEVPKGCFFVNNRGRDMECLPNNPGGKVLFLYFTDALMHDVRRNMNLPDNTLLDAPDAPSQPTHFFEHIYRHTDTLTESLNVLARQVSSDGMSRRDLTPDVFYRFAEKLLVLQNGVSKEMRRLNARTPATREELYRRVLTARDFMHDHWQQELVLPDIARQACLSPYHFHRSFREAFGVSPGLWLRRKKMEKAKMLLETGHVTVTETAQMCGFADVFSFSKAFKKVWGVSPGGVSRT